MNKQQISDYLCTTPYNTNPVIVKQLLNDYKDTICNFYENSNLTKINDFLYEMDLTRWDYSNSKIIFDNEVGACSSMRNGNFVGRNYDWKYDKVVEYVMHSHGYNGRHSSLGLAAGIQTLTYDNPNLTSFSDLYEAIPMRMLDGINDCGFVCSSNVVPNGDKGITYGTNPKKPTIYGISLIRYLLDYAETAEMAIDLLDNINLVNGYKDKDFELHFMISDPNYTYVIETVDNKIKVIENFVENKPIMTNFYLHGFNGTKESLTPFGAGFERYNKLSAAFDGVTDSSTMLSAMQSVNYTNAYKDETNPFWYTELVGDYTEFGLGVLTTQSSAEEFAVVKAAMQEMFRNRQRDGKTWQTLHTSVYDIENKSLTIVNQEGTTARQFTLE